MRHTLPLFLLLLAACSSEDRNATPAEPVNVPATEQATPPAAEVVDTAAAPGMVHLYSLAGSGLRFDGVYGHSDGAIHYYMRFFERGNVALIAGQQKPGDPVDLRSHLRQDVKSGENNVHNVPVTVRNDSLFFSTMAPRGAITYAGVVQGDTVRFLKHSKITGKQALISYGFQPY